MSDRTVPAVSRREDGRAQIIQSIVQQAASRFDPDVLVAMEKRDNALIEDEIVHGVQSSAFVYSISLGGKRAEGITVVGARHLAAKYGGIQATIISTLSKRGAMFISRSFPYGGFPGRLDVQQIPDLREEEDFYEVVIEIHDIKSANKIPSSRREYRYEKRSEASMRTNPQQDPYFERPHLEQIAFSKAFRNGVTSIIPQDFVLQFKTNNLALNADTSFVGSLMEEKRSGVLRYAAARAIAVDRDTMERLTFDQIAGLADAAREGSAEGFVQSAQALGIIVGSDEQDGRLVRRVVDPPKPPAETTKQVTNGQRQGGNQQQQKADAKPKEQVAKQQDKPDPADSKPAVVEHKVAPPKDEPKRQDLHPEFDHHAFGEDGNEALAEGTGYAIHFSSATDFANWYRAAYAASNGKDALAEHNADALSDAALDPAAMVILEAIGEPKADEQPEGQKAADEKPAEEPAAKRQPVPIATPPNWTVYNAAVAEDLKTVTTKAEMDDWVALNDATYKSNRRPGSKSNFTARIEPMIAEKYKQWAGPPRDRDLEVSNGLVGDLENVKSEAELKALGSNPAVQAFVNRMGQEKRDDITARLREANRAAQSRIKAAQQSQEGSGGPPDDGDPGYTGEAR